MSLMPSSPRPIKTKAEKRNDNRKYELTVQQFSEEIKEIVLTSGFLFRVCMNLYQRNKGAVVTVKDGSNRYDMNKKDFGSAVKTLHAHIKQLKQIFKNSRHKRRVSDPASLKGVYAPIYCGEALRTFIAAAPEPGFGPLTPVNGPNGTIEFGGNGEYLIDAIPRAKEGYMLRICVILLAYDYFRSNNLQDEGNGQFVTSDDHMKACFYGDIAADFYTYGNPDDPTKRIREPMDLAVARGVIDGPRNVYQALAEFKPYRDDNGQVRMTEDKPRMRAGAVSGMSKGREQGFPLPDVENDQPFRTYFMQSIASYCFYTVADVRQQVNDAQDAEVRAAWEEIYNNLTDSAFTDALIAEHATIVGTNEEWERIRAPINKANRSKKGTR